MSQGFQLLAHFFASSRRFLIKASIYRGSAIDTNFTASPLLLTVKISKLTVVNKIYIFSLNYIYLVFAVDKDCFLCYS